MKQYKKNFELKNTAKDTLNGKYTGAVLLDVLYALISWAAQFLINTVAITTMNTVYFQTGSENAANTISLLFDLVLLAVSAVLFVMNAGMTLYYLNMACKQPLSIKDLFYGFKMDSPKPLLIAGAIILCQAVCLYPCRYLLHFYLNTRDGRWLLYACIALAVGVCVYLPTALGIKLSFYLMLDFPQKSAKETLSLCWRMMKGQRKRLFYLELSFLPLMLLCVLSFGIGFLWLEPYMNMTYTYFYLDLMNPREV